MARRAARTQGLHSVPEDPGAVPALLGTRCAACSRRFFPPRRHGCPACGAGPQALETVELEGRGSLRAFAIVRRSPFPALPVPYAVAQVALDAGIETEAVIGNCDLGELRIGLRVRAALEPAGRPKAGDERVVCRFIPEAGA
jgi:uncharacterized OB-fold protein